MRFNEGGLRFSESANALGFCVWEALLNVDLSEVPSRQSAFADRGHLHQQRDSRLGDSNK